MKKAAKSMNAVPGMRSWQEIAQRSTAKPLSPVAGRKRLVQNFGLAATVALAVALVALVVWGLCVLREGPARENASLHSALQKVDFKTNGVLNEAWVRDYLKLSPGEPLQKYDVFALRKSLLECKQVSDAMVERVLPGTLRIRLSEREPWLRIAADNGMGGYTPYLVARDGTVFDGKLYADDVLAHLPWLAGVALHHAADGGFTPIAGADAVAELLTVARGSVPQLTEQWTVVDLAQFDPRPAAPLSLIKIRTRNLGELVFLASDFRTQIDRLALTAHELQDRQLTPKRVDFSFENQVVVQPLTALPAAAAKSRKVALR